MWWGCDVDRAKGSLNMQYALTTILVVAGFVMCIALFSLRDPVNLREFHKLFFLSSENKTENIKLRVFQGSYLVVLLVAAYFIFTDFLFR
jgi:hypothetical protein